MVGSNLEVEIGSNSEVLAGTEVAEETVVVLQLSVLLALEGIQEEERQSSVCVLSEGKIFPVGRKIFSCRMEELGMQERLDEAIYLIELNDCVKDYLRKVMKPKVKFTTISGRSTLQLETSTGIPIQIPDGTASVSYTHLTLPTKRIV